MERLSVGRCNRLSPSRLSPIPSGANIFPTVLEEPNSPSAEDNQKDFYTCTTSSSNGAGSGTSFGSAYDQQSQPRRHRRRLPLLSNTAAALSKSKSSLSFDSGISCLLSESGSPSPPLTVDPMETYTPGSNVSAYHTPTSDIGSPIISRQHSYSSSSYSNYLSATSSPCHSPGPPKSPSRFQRFQRSMSTTASHIPPPVSPTLKRPNVFNSRRFSDNPSTIDPPPFSFSPSRTLSPISVSPQHISKSPSPSYSNHSSKSSPVQGREGTSPSSNLKPSCSFHSNDSDESPPNLPSPGSPTNSKASVSHLERSSSPIFRSRRLLPETPKVPQTRDYASSHRLLVTGSGSNNNVSTHNSSNCSSSSNNNGSIGSCANQSSTTPGSSNSRSTFNSILHKENIGIKEGRKSLSSHDSFDSGVYSRSTTSDSRKMSSPGAIGRDTSPALMRHNSWRQRRAKLPEPPRQSLASSTSGLDWKSDYKNSHQGSSSARFRNYSPMRSMTLPEGDLDPDCSLKLDDTSAYAYKYTPATYNRYHSGGIGSGYSVSGSHRVHFERHSMDFAESLRISPEHDLPTHQRSLTHCDSLDSSKHASQLTDPDYSYLFERFKSHNHDPRHHDEDEEEDYMHSEEIDSRAIIRHAPSPPPTNSSREQRASPSLHLLSILITIQYLLKIIYRCHQDRGPMLSPHRRPRARQSWCGRAQNERF
ncbi:uncharacterized protein LOC131886061 [Tigriopus californicus]|uniref:uncharacterized protein LOC131886061 n=1 Tax=Tigriopus californicus TaxID=6832 RepID=UPI0027D9FA2E|nr:uncharacterized protein LOC131886061 [Tigriopus californicus]